jgi:1-acyl-sn-glycerol-3-phosphate acyltransferase
MQMSVQAIANKRELVNPYNHSRWETRRRILRFLVRYIGIPLLVKIDHVEGLENIPANGAGILMINHVAFVDSIFVLHEMPRNIVPMAKVEVYDYPVIGIFPRLWGVIPVRREEVDRQALRGALDVLGAGEIILMAPEGTRTTGSGLQEGKEGISYIATRSSAPIFPTAVVNTAGFPALRGTSRWKGPGAELHFGKPFRFKSELGHPNRQLLRKMTDEAMYVLSAMLPERLRGIYSDLTKATQDTLEWL